MTFLEWVITWFFADHLASKQEQAGEQERLTQEIKDLKAQIEGFRKSKGREEDQR
jgi:hypothetical protein